MIENERHEFFNSASDVVLVADVKTGMLVDANLAAQKFFGKDLKSIRRMHQSQIHPKSERAKYRQLFKKHMKQGSGILKDLYIVDKNNKSIPFDIGLRLMVIGGRTYALGIFRDISERKKSEIALQKSEEKYRSLVNNTQDIIYIADSDYKVSFVSPQITRYGILPEEVIGDHMLKWIHPDDHEVVHEADEGADDECREGQPRLIAAKEVESLQPLKHIREGGNSQNGKHHASPYDDASHAGGAHFVMAVEAVELMRGFSVKRKLTGTLFPRFIFVQIVRE